MQSLLPYLKESLRFLWRLMGLGSQWINQEIPSAFPGSLATGVGGTWSSCSSGLMKGFLGMLPLSHKGGGTTLLLHSSCLKSEASAVKVVLATDPQSQQ